MSALDIFEQVTNSFNNLSENENIYKNYSEIISKNKSSLTLKDIFKIHH